MRKPGGNGVARGAAIAMAVALPLDVLGGCSPFEATPAPMTEACYGPSDGTCLPPDQWPDACVVGNNNRQSPLDLTATSYAAMQGLIERYAPHDEITVVTNGLTLMVDFQGSADAVALPGGQSCKLSQLHFHTTSEHLFGGTSFPVEAHLVHQCGAADLLVVSVMMTYLEDQANPVLGAALDHVATDAAGFARGTVTTSDVAFSATDLLPPTRLGAFFHYSGSLTTPPCTEDVDWYVLGTPVSVSKAQVAGLEQVLIDTSANGFGHNNRPTQDLGGRTIERNGHSLSF